MKHFTLLAALIFWKGLSVNPSNQDWVVPSSFGVYQVSGDPIKVVIPDAYKEERIISIKEQRVIRQNQIDYEIVKKQRDMIQGIKGKKDFRY